MAALLAFLAIGAALPVLPVFVHGPLHASNFAVGIVVGAFSVTSVFCRPLAGRFADSRGRRIVLVVAAFVMSAGGILYLLAGSVASLVAARLVVGMGEGALYTAGATWAVDLAPARRQGLALGLFGLAVWGGLSLGPLVGELLRSAAGYNAVWLLTAVLPFVGGLIAICLPEPVRAHARPGEAADGALPAPGAAPRGGVGAGQLRLRRPRRVRDPRPALLRRERRGERVHRLRLGRVPQPHRLQHPPRSPGPTRDRHRRRPAARLSAWRSSPSPTLWMRRSAGRW